MFNPNWKCHITRTMTKINSYWSSFRFVYLNIMHLSSISQRTGLINGYKTSINLFLNLMYCPLQQSENNFIQTWNLFIKMRKVHKPKELKKRFTFNRRSYGNWTEKTLWIKIMNTVKGQMWLFVASHKRRTQAVR